MSKHHHRRKFAATSGKRLTNLNTATLDQQLDETLRRVRAEFESTGKICSRFECVTDGESFHVAANWPDRNARVRYARCCGPGSRAGPGCADRRQSFFYQKNCWVIPLEALRDMEKLPGKERLLAMPPYKNPDLSDETTDVD